MRYPALEILRLLDEEGKMAFLSGPRQVGKTTLARFLLKGSAGDGYFNWDAEAHRRAILKDPAGFWRTSVEVRSGAKPRVVLDEIHKYPRWKRFLKGLYDLHGRGLEMLVTGSGRLDVYQRGGDSLFGRYGSYRLHPFTLGECLSRERAGLTPPGDFWRLVKEPAPRGAEEALKDLERFTGFPEPLFAASDSRMNRWRRSHRELVLREDLRDLTRIRDLGLVDALTSLLPERVGSPLSVHSLQEDLGVAFGTVQGWLAALDRLYWLFEIRPFAGRLSRALKREGKTYLFDFTSVPEAGPRFENLVALHLRKLCDGWNDWGWGNFGLHYLRNKEKKETDFLVTEGGRPLALVEAKLSGDRVDPSLAYFTARLKPRYAFQVVRNLKSAVHADALGIACLPAAAFLSRA